MPTFIANLNQLLLVIKENIPFALLFVAILWVIYIINALVGFKLNRLGIMPRRVSGLPGIIFSPFLHANFNHLFFNTVPLLVLITFLLTYGLYHYYFITVLIILLSGALTWLFGRSAIHIGASSLVMGYWGYLLIKAILDPSLVTIILALICFYYFLGLFFSIMPTRDRTSWEGHLFGLIAGLIVAYLFG